MSEINYDRKDIIMKSLQYYSEALTKLLAKEELPEMVKLDLKNESIKLYNLQSSVKTSGVKQILDESNYEPETEGSAKLVCSALTCYIKGLEKSISAIDELYGDMNIPLQSTRKDIELAHRLLKEIPKCQQSSSST